MENSRSRVSRPMVGCIAAALLATAVALSIWPGGRSSGAGITWRAGCTRVGIVMAAFWLALPSGNRPAAWANLSPKSLAAAALASLALFRVPFRFLLPMIAILLLVGVVVRPRPRVRPERPSDYSGP